MKNGWGEGPSDFSSSSRNEWRRWQLGQSFNGRGENVINMEEPRPNRLSQRNSRFRRDKGSHRTQVGQFVDVPKVLLLRAVQKVHKLEQDSILHTLYRNRQLRDRPQVLFWMLNEEDGTDGNRSITILRWSQCSQVAEVQLSPASMLVG